MVSVVLILYRFYNRFEVVYREKVIEDLEMIQDVRNKWINADVLIFNARQWWVSKKFFEIGCYFQVENSIKLGMSIPAAFRITLGSIGDNLIYFLLFMQYFMMLFIKLISLSCFIKYKKQKY